MYESPMRAGELALALAYRSDSVRARTRASARQWPLESVMGSTCRTSELALALACQVLLLSPGTLPPGAPVRVQALSHTCTVCPVCIYELGGPSPGPPPSCRRGTTCGRAEHSSARVPEQFPYECACFSDARRYLIYILEPKPTNISLISLTQVISLSCLGYV